MFRIRKTKLPRHQKNSAHTHLLLNRLFFFNSRTNYRTVDLRFLLVWLNNFLLEHLFAHNYLLNAAHTHTGDW